MKKTGGKRDQPIVFLGAGMNDRSSYNAALRAGTLSWTAYWYRGGVETWVAYGLPTTSTMPPRTSDPSTAPCSIGARATKSAGVNSFAQIKKDLKPYMGQ